MATSYYTTQSLTIFITTFMAFSCTLVLGNNLPASTISAAPALLPDPISPSSSSPPALSPDMYPVFPSPGGPELAPSDSSAPLIPSSPSPPNPDALAAPGPGAALSPMGMQPDSSSRRRSPELFFCSLLMLFAAFSVHPGFTLCSVM
ncbi:classical arabinogalactan protein 26-like [Salvia miltiorrhiza]|uniref:classical arabinogalactan protein 26-like n=1 Tax=Salvia miltiorrhiza TaxID=226208 RepID=UPI0025ACC5AE|nr:classical arabinogalactan protein 26-like [Salvia miltiorrhiza]